MDTREKAIRIILGIKNHLLNDSVDANEETIKYVEQMSAFTIIAHCTGLTRQYGNVYKDEDGTYFVQTKFGFQPSETFNKGLQNRELRMEIRRLEKIIAENNKEVNTVHESKEILLDKLTAAVLKIEQQKKEINELKQLLKKNEDYRNELLLDKKEMNVAKAECTRQIHDLEQLITNERRKHKLEVLYLKNLLPNHEPQIQAPAEINEPGRDLTLIIQGMKAALKSTSISATNKVNRLQSYVTRLEQMNY